MLSLRFSEKKKIAGFGMHNVSLYFYGYPSPNSQEKYFAN